LPSSALIAAPFLAGALLFATGEATARTGTAARLGAAR
jgi:hypothetical protein